MSQFDLDEWDGRELPYRPGDELNVPTGVDLHRNMETEVDPISYEVIRHALWNQVMEAGNVVENLAISPITLETRDFQTAIFTEEGEFIFFGPFIQYFGGMLDLTVKWIIENRGEDTGIRPGDMFLCNDPWIGVGHQPDAALIAPIFQDGKIFAWAVTVMHQNDVGGTVAGSFCPNAQDVYWDPPIFPGLKIVEGGEIVADKEGVYQRQTRTPLNLSMDLRAALGANNHMMDQMHELVKKYGASTVKGVMYEGLGNEEQDARSLLSRLPDGTWSERIYQERAITGDDGVYRIELTLRKDGERLIFDNKGTEEQIGAINLPYCGWRGAIVSQAKMLLQPDLFGAPGGLLRCMEFQPEPGTITCPTYGAAVSPAGIYAAEVGIAMANNVISKMLLSSDDEDHHQQAMAPPQGQWNIAIGEGTDDQGNYYIAQMLDQMIGSSGATPTADGYFANGQSWVPEGRGSNVELYERKWPILVLYRGEHQDSAGAGKNRGGNGGKMAFVTHGGDMALGVYSAEGIPKTPSVLSGYPGSRGETTVLHDTNIQDDLGRSQIPEGISEVDGNLEVTVGKGNPISIQDDTVVEWWWGSTPGYGDPLDRNPEKVANDVQNGIVSKKQAIETYGVILTENRNVSEEETDSLREQMRKKRLTNAERLERFSATKQ